MKNKKIFTGNYYICKKFAMILIVLIVFTGCGQNRITEKEEKKETVESEMNAEVKKTAQTFRSVYMKEKSELNTLKAKRKIINCLEEKGYAAVDCDNQIDMVNREKVEEFCKAAEKEEQATLDIVVVFDEGEIIQYHLESMNGKINVRLCQVKWKDNSPQANYYDEYEAYEWKHTEKGYLLMEAGNNCSYSAKRCQRCDFRCAAIHQRPLHRTAKIGRHCAPLRHQRIVPFARVYKLRRAQRLRIHSLPPRAAGEGESADGHEPE